MSEEKDLVENSKIDLNSYLYWLPEVLQKPALIRFNTNFLRGPAPTGFNSNRKRRYGSGLYTINNDLLVFSKFWICKDSGFVRLDSELMYLGDFNVGAARYEKFWGYVYLFRPWSCPGDGYIHISDKPYGDLSGMETGDLLKDSEGNYFIRQQGMLTKAVR